MINFTDYDFKQTEEFIKKAELWACIIALRDAGFREAAEFLKQRDKDADKDEQ
jgi:hypothetical protein